MSESQSSHPMTRRKLLGQASLSIAVLSSILVACRSQPMTAPTATGPASSGGAAATQPAQQPSAKPTVVVETTSPGASSYDVVWWYPWGQPERHAAVADILKMFSKQNPQISVKAELVPWGQALTQWIAAHQAGQAPELIILDGDPASVIYSAGGADPANDVIKELGGPPQFLKGPLSGYVLPDGKIFAIPYYTFPWQMYYRLDRLEEAGLKAPTTWDEHLTIATKLTDASKNSFAWAFEGGAPLTPLFRGNGTAWFNEKGEVQYLNSKNLESMQYGVDLTEKSAPAGTVDYSEDDISTRFTSGQTSFVYMWPIILKSIYDKKLPWMDKVRVIEVPPKVAGTKFPAEVSTPPIVLVKSGRNVDQRNTFAEFLFTADPYLRFLATATGVFPTNEATAKNEKFFQDPAIKEFRPLVDFLIQQSLGGAASDQAPGKALNPLNSQLTVNADFTHFYQLVMVGKKTVKEAAQQLMQTIQENQKRIDASRH